MPPRRGHVHGGPVGRGRGRQPAETEMQRNMRILEERLEAMERKKHSDNLDDSDETPNPNPLRKKKNILMNLKS